MQSDNAAKHSWLSRIFGWLKALDESVSLNESELLFRRVEALEQQVKELNAHRNLAS